MSQTEPLATLPAILDIGNLAACKPVVVVDSREQNPLAFTRLASVRAGLDTADYSFIGGETIFGVERKSIEDLVACCVGSNRDRFERELIRLRGYRFKRLLIVGTPVEIAAHKYRGQTHPKTVMHTLSAFEARYDLPVVWSPTPAAAAEQVESWVWWNSREIAKAANALLAGMQVAVPNGGGNSDG